MNGEKVKIIKVWGSAMIRNEFLCILARSTTALNVKRIGNENDRERILFEKSLCHNKQRSAEMERNPGEGLSAVEEESPPSSRKQTHVIAAELLQIFTLSLFTFEQHGK